MLKNRNNRLDILLKYFVGVILLMIPLYPKFPLINVPGTYVSVRLDDFVMVISTVFLLIYLKWNITNLFKDRVQKAILLFLIVGLTSLFSGIFITKTVIPHIGILHWLRRIEYFVPYFIGFFAVLKNKENLEFYVKIIMVVILVSFIYGLGQRFLNWPIIVTQNLEYSQGVALRYIPGSHINASFAGHYDLGTYMVFFLPLFISAFFLLRETKTKIILFLTIAAGLWLLSFSGSRISAFSYLLASTVSLVLLKKYRAIPAVFLVSFLFFSMSQNLTSRYLRLFDVTTKKLIGNVENVTYVKDVLAQTGNPGVPEKRNIPAPTPTPMPVFEDRSTAIRLNVEWPRALRSFAKNPLFGTGYSSLTLATDNDFLRLFGEVGLLGFMSFFLILIRFFEPILEKIPFTDNLEGIKLAFISGITGGFLGILVNAMLLDVFEASKFAITFWLIMGILMASINKVKYE